MTSGERWSDMRPRTRKLLLTAAAIEGGLKVAALIDLRRRPAREVNGSKLRWAVAIVVINSAGVVPTAYFVRGRRT